MSITNFEPKHSTDEISIVKGRHKSSKGITKRLLEKYKPKVLYKIKGLNDRKNNQRVA